MNPVIQSISLHRHEVDVLRLDLMTPQGIGNKYYKLKENIKAAKQKGVDTLLSFGGPFSNHIHALALTGKQHGLATIGIIRGDEDKDNPTLKAAGQHGMQLYFVSRTEYREKEQGTRVAELLHRNNSIIVLPEGGTNPLAVQGCASILDGVHSAYNHIMLAVGTGGTMAGVLAGISPSTRLTGVAVLKGEDTLTDKIRELAARNDHNNWNNSFGHHEGGYARTSPELIERLKSWYDEYQLPTDPVYTGKLVLAAERMIRSGAVPGNEKLLLIHTGGLQGLDGWMYMEEKKALR